MTQETSVIRLTSCAKLESANASCYSIKFLQLGLKLGLGLRLKWKALEEAHSGPVSLSFWHSLWNCGTVKLLELWKEKYQWMQRAAWEPQEVEKSFPLPDRGL